MNTKDRIIQAAIEVFSADYSATTEKVANKADVSRRTLLRYFKNKKLLVLEVAHSIMSNYYSKVKAAHAQSEDSLVRLELMFYGSIDCGNQLNFLRALIEQNEIEDDDSIFDDFGDLFTIFSELFSDLKERGLLSPHVTIGWAEYAFHGMSEGAVMALKYGAVAERDLYKMAWKSYWNSIKKH
ncbi:TetR/AcrR family transcriptional regulator [bacterium SCSIO 12741]|nr:TetR/AcrR family transcriptional regulator [bacterium SCSIO 12741]